MVELVFEPSVQLVAHTMIDTGGMFDWAEKHGLEPVLEDDNTPLGVLWNDLHSSGDADKAIDALPEFGGRFCYRAWKRGRPRDEYIANIIEMEHGSVLEHSVVSFAVSGVSRSLSHELVRHRAGAAISQESQRYVDAQDIRFVVPPLVQKLNLSAHFGIMCDRDLEEYVRFQAMLRLGLESASVEDVKLATLDKKRVNEASRALLPNASETRLLWTMNMRTARHVCALRGGVHADLEIRRLAVEFTNLLKVYAPLIFADFEVYEAEDGFPAVRCARPKV